MHSLPYLNTFSSSGVGGSGAFSYLHLQLLYGSSFHGSVKGESMGHDWVQTSQLSPQKPASAVAHSLSPKMNSVGSGLSASHLHLAYGSLIKRTESEGHDILQEMQLSTLAQSYSVKLMQLSLNTYSTGVGG